MGIRFNADEIFGIAERIEENGVKFYRAAAGKVSSDASRLLLDLAKWEEAHKAKFAQMRKSLAEADREITAFDPNDEAALYLQSLADGSVFDLTSDPVVALGDEPTFEQVLRTALGREKDAIVFFTGMQKLVPASLGKRRISDIITEEMTHVSILTKELRALKRA